MWDLKLKHGTAIGLCLLLVLLLLAPSSHEKLEPHTFIRDYGEFLDD